MSWRDFTITDLIAKIRRNLGEVIIDGEVCVQVEISGEMVNDSVCDALRRLSRFQPKREFIVEGASSATKYIDILDVGMGVLNVYPEGLAKGHTEFTDFGFQEPIDPGNVDDFALQAMYTEMSQRQFSSDFQWKLVGERLLLEDVPERTTKISIEIGVPLEEPKDVPLDWQEWVEDYATALSRLKLGELRSKFSGIPGAGGQVQLNGSDLIQQANERIQLLDERLTGRTPLEAPIFG